MDYEMEIEPVGPQVTVREVRIIIFTEIRL
jgi:hypothetical protein